jgi:two-component system KDP operon response regulator KdpE
MARILVAFDNQGYSSLLTDALGAAGSDTVSVCKNTLFHGPVALDDAALILIEMASGELHITSICERLRSANGAPIVVFGAGLAERDIVHALDAGADDILLLPMRQVEIAARLRAVMRRINHNGSRVSDGRLVAGDVEIDLDGRRAYRNDRELALSPLELKLLTALVRGGGRPLSHAELISHVWGPEYVDCRNYLRLYIRYLRKVIEDDPGSPQIILNEWGTGYRLDASPAALNVA